MMMGHEEGEESVRVCAGRSGAKPSFDRITTLSEFVDNRDSNNRFHDSSQRRTTQDQTTDIDLELPCFHNIHNSSQPNHGSHSIPPASNSSSTFIKHNINNRNDPNNSTDSITTIQPNSAQVQLPSKRVRKNARVENHSDRFYWGLLKKKASVDGDVDALELNLNSASNTSSLVS